MGATGAYKTASLFCDYDLAALPLDSHRIRGGPARRIRVAGRTGLNIPSIKGRVLIPRHTVNASAGTLALWVMSLDDIGDAIKLPQHSASNRFFDVYTLLSDREAVQAFEPAHFHFTFMSGNLWAKFYMGTLMDALYRSDRKALANTNSFEIDRLQWYQFVLTWDRALGEYSIYANGILVGTQDHMAHDVLINEPCGEFLFLGIPCLVYSRLTFYNGAMAAPEVAALFAQTAVNPDPSFQRKLRIIHAGEGIEPLDASVAANWPERLALPLNRPTDLEAFYVQGCQTAGRITPEGLHVKTPPIEDQYRLLSRLHDESEPFEDNNRVYFWTNQTFEGDLYIRYQFKILAHGGLSLLVTQAAGMQGEDFIREYPLRTNGNMRTITSQDVRDYIWEYYREMTDCRNDLAATGIGKVSGSGRLSGLTSRTENRVWDLDTWHTLEYLQVGNRISGAIDGRKVVDCEDNGSVLRNGHIAIRCMMRTDMVFRDLSVRTRQDYEVLPEDAKDGIRRL